MAMKNNPFEPGTNRWIAPFLLIASGQVLSLVGTQLVQFAIVWWITKSTGSATALATASMIALLPGIILGPFIGTLVDRWNRRRIMIIADSISAMAMVVMVYLFWSGHNQIWNILIIIFIRAVANSFHWPAMQASMTLMVPKEHYPRVQGLNQMVMGIMMISAAPLGALVLELLPIYGVLAIDIVTATIAIIPLILIPIPQPKRLPTAEGETGSTTVLQEFRQGLRYVFGWTGMVIFMVMVALINLLSTPGSSLLPLMVTQHFLGRALQLAWLQAAFGVGTIAGGILLGIWGGFRRRIVTTLVGLIATGIATIFLGLLPPRGILFAVAISFFLGFTNPITNGPLTAILQGTVTPQMQGRVFTLMTSFAGIMTPVGLMIAGPIADTYGVRAWYLVGGIVTLLLGLGAFMVPALMHLEDSMRTPSPLPSLEDTALPQAPHAD